MIRTENYSNREWTQWEILEAKRFNTPVVCLDACTKTQFQGSFIFDNVPRVTYPSNEKHCDTRKVNDLQSRAIIEALNLLVDICLKQHIWNHLFASEKDSPQTQYGNTSTRTVNYTEKKYTFLLTYPNLRNRH